MIYKPLCAFTSAAEMHKDSSLLQIIFQFFQSLSRFEDFFRQNGTKGKRLNCIYIQTLSQAYGQKPACCVMLRSPDLPA